MSTVGDALVSWERLNEFRCRLTMLTLSCGDPNVVEVLGNLPAVLERRHELINRATALFQAIGQQICKDHGVEWGTAETSRIDRNVELSEAAEAKLREFKEFLAQHP